MQKRLMFGRDPRRCDNRRQRLDTLAFTWHQEANAIILQGLGPIGVPDYLGKRPYISIKTGSARFR
jgi:hypothetical protein